MPALPPLNRRIVLASRPQGAPQAHDFRLEQVALPVPEKGEVLLQTLYLSLDPYMRGRMSDAASYAPPLALGEVMVGGAVARVAVSHDARFAPGDLVLASSGWQEWAALPGDTLTPLGDLAHPSWALGLLGMPGFTAWHGLLHIGQPRAGETVVVAAASGAVGAVVGQIAKLKGARVVGIAGGPDKCQHVVSELGFDACLDRHAPDFAAQLAAVCPAGIDVYFESVGGPVFDAVLPLLNEHARVPVCGSIAHYNEGQAQGPRDRLPQLMSALVFKRIRLEGFIILDHYEDSYAQFLREMNAWVSAGQIRSREDVVDGLEQAPQALIGLLEGRNFGKVVVRVGV